MACGGDEVAGRLWGLKGSSHTQGDSGRARGQGGSSAGTRGDDGSWGLQRCLYGPEIHYLQHSLQRRDLYKWKKEKARKPRGGRLELAVYILAS